MPKDSEKVRLPELPVFKKYSLALRQEFASVDEILSVLERTTTKIRDSIERADEERRRQEQAIQPDDVDDPEVQEFDEEQISDDDSPQQADLDDIERPFWEEPLEEDEPVPTPSGSSKSRTRTERPAKARAKPKTKTKRTRPSVVPVGHHGKPIAPKKPAPKKSAPKKPAPKKPAPKKPVRSKPKSRTGSRRR